MEALIFDCDGVLVDTERDGHRVAFNQAFARKGLDTRWGVEQYGELLAVAGGKERMRLYFERHGWPPGVGDRDALIRELHESKTELYMRIIEDGRLPLRPGVARLVDEAIAAGITLAICSTSNEKAVRTVARVMLGPGRVERLSAILAGDVVSRKKPDPEIYELAARTLRIEPGRCVVIEDSRNGLLAAKSAGMWCIITKSCYTQAEDFTEADAVYPELGDPPEVQVTIRDLQRVGA
jgi:beta-phosphoglucomutase-like phosphatase (HAD superfamily)